MDNQYCKIQLVNGIDYDGKLNDHEDYLKMLKILVQESIE